MDSDWQDPLQMRNPGSRRSFLSRAGKAGFALGAGQMTVPASAAQQPELAYKDTSKSGLGSISTRVIDVGQRAEMFLHDDHLIEAREGLTLFMGQVEKYPGNPLITADQPWEKGFLGYGCLLHDVEEGVYKMWYEVRDEKDNGRCLYATSRDGLAWQKPVLDEVEYEGLKRNNIVFFGQRGAKTKVYWVIKDYADPDPDKRYKMMHHLWDFGGRGIGIAHSPNGIRWRSSPYVNMHGGFDTQNILFWESRIGQYAGYFRGWLGGRRYISRATSPDGYHWSEPVVVHGPDSQDPLQWDLYTPAVIKSSGARDVYYMLPAAFDWPSNTLHGQLALSRDGISWFRFRKPFLPLGQQGTWDHGSIYPVPSEVVVGGKTAIYYRGNDAGHGTGGRPGLGVAFLHEAGFAGWQALGEGMLVTHPLRIGDARQSFYLNADAKRGAIRAELLNAANQVMPGFSRAECQEINGSGSRLPLTWRGRDSLEAVVRGGPVRLKIYLRRATVYGFECRRPA